MTTTAISACSLSIVCKEAHFGFQSYNYFNVSLVCYNENTSRVAYLVIVDYALKKFLKLSTLVRMHM